MVKIAVKPMRLLVCFLCFWGQGLLNAQNIMDELSEMSSRFETSNAFSMDLSSKVYLQTGQQSKSDGIVYKYGDEYYSEFNDIVRFTTGSMSVAIDNRSKLILITDYRKEDQQQMQMEMIQFKDSVDMSKYKIDVKKRNDITEYIIADLPGYEKVMISFTPEHLLRTMVYHFRDNEDNGVNKVELTYGNYYFDQQVKKRNLNQSDSYMIRNNQFIPLKDLKEYRLVDNRKA